MKVSKINIEIKEKFFVEYAGLDRETYKTKLNEALKKFLDTTQDIQVIETGEIKDVYSDGKKDKNPKYNNYSGYFVKYYEGLLVIDGSNISMKIALNKKIIELALKEVKDEIKELVKQEYNEFENQLNQLVDKTVNKFKEEENINLNKK